METEFINILRNHLIAENSQDLDGTLATLHADCVFRDHATGQVWLGRDGAAEHYRQWWRSFDVAVERGPGQSSFWASKDVYVAQATWRGTHIGTFLDIPATGNPITLPFTVFVTFKDGLMVSEEFFYDLASLLRQLGVERIPELAVLPFREADSGMGAAWLRVIVTGANGVLGREVLTALKAKNTDVRGLSGPAQAIRSKAATSLPVTFWH